MRLHISNLYWLEDADRVCRLCGENHTRNISCESYRGKKRSLQITLAHKKGRFCKHWQECSICGELKYFIRMLKHYIGDCKHNTNPNSCPVCHNRNATGNYLAGPYFSKKQVVKGIYLRMMW